MRISCTGEISRPPEIVFPWIAEPAKAMQWQKNVKNSEILVSSPGMVGTRFRETVEEDGNRLEMNGAVTGFDRDRFIAFHLSSRIHEFDVSYSLERRDDKTRFSIEASVRWKFPMNVVALVIGKRMQKRLAEQLSSEAEELRSICESESADRRAGM